MKSLMSRAGFVAVIACGSLGAQLPAAGTPPRQPSPCPSAAVNHQFDFWIGSWTVTPWAAGPTTPGGAGGTNVVEPDLEQCLLVENWRASNGSRGRSFNFYDTNQMK
ncbi:MAG TPA: hypothetical protein VGQ30_01670, partial [Gemmatimonadaceae bacterium]|nr:hypothetical protein [Gemmatimonadaceae bacterium]